MRGEWEEFQFSDLCDITRGASPRPIHDWISPAGTPWVKISDATASGTRFITRTAECIRDEGRERSVVVYPGDLILSNSATPGMPKLMGIEACIHDGWLLLRNLRRIDKLYAFYVLLRDRPLLVGKGNGSVFTNLKTEILKTHRIKLPPLPEQKAIAHILGTLDDKIELNRRMNATLEAMARALFQSWFVDFDPVRAKLDGRKPVGLDEETAALFPVHFWESEDSKLPTGWRQMSIEELCVINAWSLAKGDDMDTLEYVEISEVNRGNIANISSYRRGEEPSRARRRLRHGDTVLSTVRPDRGSYFLALNPPQNRIVSTGFAVLTPAKAPWAFIHAALTQAEFSEHLGQLADGGAYPAVQPEIIGAWKVVVPDNAEILAAFQDICAPLFEEAEANRNESRTLAILRDTLLLKLLSGELGVAKTKAESDVSG